MSWRSSNAISRRLCVGQRSLSQVGYCSSAARLGIWFEAADFGFPVASLVTPACTQRRWTIARLSIGGACSGFFGSAPATTPSSQRIPRQPTSPCRSRGIHLAQAGLGIALVPKHQRALSTPSSKLAFAAIEHPGHLFRARTCAALQNLRQAWLGSARPQRHQRSVRINRDQAACPGTSGLKFLANAAQGVKIARQSTMADATRLRACITSVVVVLQTSFVLRFLTLWGERITKDADLYYASDYVQVATLRLGR